MKLKKNRKFKPTSHTISKGRKILRIKKNKITMKKKLYTFLATVMLVVSVCGQMGINTTTPSATLHVNPLKTDVSTSEGFIAPRVTGEQLYNANIQSVYGVDQDGTIVFVTIAPSLVQRIGQVIDVDSRGYYYYSYQVNKWIKMISGSGARSAIATLNCEGIVQNGTGNLVL